MPMNLKTFKARFGKKPLDEETPRERSDRLALEMKAKLAAGLKRGDPVAVDADKELKLLLAAEKWSEAGDLLQELGPKVAVDAVQAAKLRTDLAAEMKRAEDKDVKMLPQPLYAARTSVEAAIAADDYDEAAARLKGFSDIVQNFLDRCAAMEQSLIDAQALWQKVLARQNAGELVSLATEFQAMGNKMTMVLPQAVAKLEKATVDTTFSEVRVLADTLLAPISDAALKKAYTERHEASRAKLKTWEDLAALKDARLGPVQGELDTFVATLAAARKADTEDHHDVAVAKLDEAIAAVATLAGAATRRFDALAAAAPFFNKLLAGSGKAPPDLTTGLNAAALYDLASKARGELKKGAFVAAFDLIDRYEAERKNPSPVVPPVKKVSPKAAEYQKLIKDKDRAAITAALLKSDADLAGFRDQPGAIDLLDTMVADIGPKADSPEKRKFVQAAMMARFGLSQVSGGTGDKGLSTKALPRMYKVLKLLPEEHAADNEMVSSIERQKEHDTSFHQGNKVVLKAGKTGKEGGTFDDTTLHEVGHGVDAKFSFMDTNGAARQYGGWRTESFDDVKKVAGEGLDFYGHFGKKGVARGLLEKVLQLAFTGSDPKTLQGQFKAANDPSADPEPAIRKHPAVLHAIAGVGAAADDDAKRDLSFAARKLIKGGNATLNAMVQAVAEAICFGRTLDQAVTAQLGTLKTPDKLPADAVWQEMAVHPAIDFAVNARLKSGSTGLWDQGDAGAKRCSVKGRVYQEAYTNNWVSYYLSARSTKVSNYQFRAPPEWFAECYSRFFLKKLDKSHPLALWLAPQVKTTAAS